MYWYFYKTENSKTQSVKGPLERYITFVFIKSLINVRLLVNEHYETQYVLLKMHVHPIRSQSVTENMMPIDTGYSIDTLDYN